MRLDHVEGVGGTGRFPRGSAPKVRDVIEAYLGKQAVEGN
jgi:hypothetical protein